MTKPIPTLTASPPSPNGPPLISEAAPQSKLGEIDCLPSWEFSQAICALTPMCPLSVCYPHALQYHSCGPKVTDFFGWSPAQESKSLPANTSTHSQDPHKDLVTFSDDPVSSTPHSAYNFGFFKIHQEILYVGKLAGFESFLQFTSLHRQDLSPDKALNLSWSNKMPTREQKSQFSSPRKLESSQGIMDLVFSSERLSSWSFLFCARRRETLDKMCVPQMKT